jgi:sulfoxide reductase heme-binding subunit YedZ
VTADSRRLDQRYRYLYKPVVFIACLVPLLGCIGGILRSNRVASVPGFELGTDPVRWVLDTLGKTALNLLFLTLLITPLRQLSGNVQLLRLRRMLGLFAFSYALLHFLTYVGLFEAGSWTEIRKDLAKRPFTAMGFAALLLLLPLAVTSTDKMMRRLRGRWQRLHRLIYLIAPLTVLHYWKMLKHEYREPLLYGSVLVALLAFRAWRRLRASAPAITAAAAGARAPSLTSRCEPPKARGKV